MCSDPHKQIQKHFLKRNQTYIPTVYLGVIISLLNVLWGNVNIGGRSKLRRGDWTWFSFSMTLANCNHWREIDYQMMMTKINNFYSIDVLYFEFNKKIYIYVNRHKYIFFNADLPWASSKSTWSFFDQVRKKQQP